MTQTIPDLLNFEQQPVPNVTASKKALKFAFLTGDSAGAIKQLLGETTVGASDWMPDCFAKDLFIDDFIDNCLLASLDAKHDSVSRPFLKRVLCYPSSLKQNTSFRQQIQQELFANDNIRIQFEAVYSKIILFRDDLDTVSDLGRVYFSRWRIGILERLKDVVDTLATSFENATSGLTRIRDYAGEFQRSEAYQNLGEFLRYEDGMAVVNVELRLGCDGKVRGFGLTKLEENDKNRFHLGPVKRFFSRIGLVLRGYRFTGEELLEQWVDALFETLTPHIYPMLQLIGHMEFHLASFSFRRMCLDRDLKTCHPTFLAEEDSAGRRVMDLFNPHLIDPDPSSAGDHHPSLVTCNLSCGLRDAMVVLTGPNSGGKTRLLQSLGLLQLLGQAGFVVPAGSAQLRFATGMFVSLLTDTTSDQKEGRLGTELVRIRAVFEKSKRGSLIILDELCSGTNPCEGEEIFLLVIFLLRELKPEAFITTHFLRFAKDLASSSQSPDLEFLQVALDEHQRPTYRFVPGVAETSLAGHTAARLGVTKRDLLDLIRS